MTFDLDHSVYAIPILMSSVSCFGIFLCKIFFFDRKHKQSNRKGVKQ